MEGVEGGWVAPARLAARLLGQMSLRLAGAALLPPPSCHPRPPKTLHPQDDDDVSRLARQHESCPLRVDQKKPSGAIGARPGPRRKDSPPCPQRRIIPSTAAAARPTSAASASDSASTPGASTVDQPRRRGHSPHVTCVVFQRPQQSGPPSGIS